MTRLLVGTSGYSYKEWKGSFYPEELPDREMLSFYSRRFATVEINNTFYRLPSESVLRRWREEVPAGFTFVLKASRRITHEKRLRGAEEPLRYLLQSGSVLGRKAGPILFQLPPYLRKDAPRLREFLELLPAGLRAAFEFRHPSWFDDETFGLLSARGAALCIADTETSGEERRVATAPWGYLRLRRETYGEDELESWSAWVKGRDWDEAFVFFKHEEHGAGPALARRLSDIYSR